MKPPASSASPVCANQDAAPASVAQISSSKAILRRRAQSTAPSSTLSTALFSTTSTPRDANRLRNRRRTEALCPASIFVARDQRESDAVRVAPTSRPLAAQPMAHGERHLYPGRAAPDGQQPHAPLAAGDARAHDPIPALRQTVDRLEGRGVLDCAGDGAQVRRRADVEGDDVVGDCRAVAAEHAASGEIESDRLVVHQRRAGKARQRPQVDVALLRACNGRQ